jgi:ATP citrate (pro-S)-lyase
MSFISAVVVQKESKLKAARMHIYVRRGGPNYQTGLAKMRTVGADLGVPIEVLVPLPLPLSF